MALNGFREINLSTTYVEIKWLIVSRSKVLEYMMEENSHLFRIELCPGILSVFLNSLAIRLDPIEKPFMLL